MMTRTENKQIKFHMISIENLVPEKHFLRKLSAMALNLKRIVRYLG